MIGDVVMFFVGAASGAGVLGLLWCVSGDRDMEREAVDYWRDDALKWRARVLELESDMIESVDLRQHEDLRWSLNGHPVTEVDRFRDVEGAS